MTNKHPTDTKFANYSMPLYTYGVLGIVMEPLKTDNNNIIRVPLVYYMY